ncbi:NAD-dependent epimerase/dehydratase family protein [Streptomyces siderophoricus]|uniref:NAD(P)-dependent oxidoreductase n=2 Tax=Streptomyces TaxID=1883 RepID=A0ABS1MSB8_9ACTN|nr:NAD-dependent epimerase/dehydratase family protein [Streptomyces sp. 9-7]MBL1090629.1 NAD(P)-dependent oxidoreductase [Streptomyces sp. 9-7]
MGSPCRSSILVTGAAGNLGREVVDRLQARGARVRCLVRGQPGPRPGGEWTGSDLTNPAAVRAPKPLARVIPSCRCTRIWRIWRIEKPCFAMRVYTPWCGAATHWRPTPVAGAPVAVRTT